MNNIQEEKYNDQQITHKEIGRSQKKMYTSNITQIIYLDTVCTILKQENHRLLGKKQPPLTIENY